MKRIAFALLLALILLMASQAMGEGEKTICVTASSSITVEADRAVLNLGVRTTAEDAAKASSENAASVEALRAALEAAGIQENDMTTASYYVSPVYDYSGDMETVRGYQVSHVLAVTVRNLEKTGDMIDLALASGANTCDGVFFQSTQATAAYDQALVLALKEGRRKAELIALSNGKILGELLNVTENYGNPSVVYTAKAAVMDSAASGTQIIAENLNYSAEVTMVFAFQ